MDLEFFAGKKKNFLKKIMQYFAVAAFMGIICTQTVYAQNSSDPIANSSSRISIGFYKTSSLSSDLHIVSMTTDLFYTQLLALDKYEINDYREIDFSSDEQDENISFYVELNESENGGWNCRLNGTKGTIVYSTEKTYDSYYKILLDAKSALENFLEVFFDQINKGINNSSAAEKTVPKSGKNNFSGWDENFGEQKNYSLSQNTARNVPETKNNLSDTEIISGTWQGEPFIDRIVILRSGRGFVIFKNGANMTISVEFSNNDVTITQTGKPNASFFPELPREIALKNAIESKPIVWKLTLVNGELHGTKTSLQEDKSSAEGASVKNTKVIWTRK